MALSGVNLLFSIRQHPSARTGHLRSGTARRGQGAAQRPLHVSRGPKSAGGVRRDHMPDPPRMQGWTGGCGRSSALEAISASKGRATRGRGGIAGCCLRPPARCAPCCARLLVERHQLVEAGRRGVVGGKGGAAALLVAFAGKPSATDAMETVELAEALAVGGLLRCARAWGRSGGWHYDSRRACMHVRVW